MAARFLTKSRFKIGYECPTKLAFQDAKQFGNNNVDNSFLEALAEGGFQVGELAKIYFENGIEVTNQNKDEAFQKTQELLKQKNVTIFEAAIKFENLYVKVDVLRKIGNTVEIIEVKAKSFDSTEEHPFISKSSLKKGPLKLNSTWEPYIIDVAFQTFVFKKCFPEFATSSWLMLADKNAECSVDGLNQRFLIQNEKGKPKIKISENTNVQTVGKPLLKRVNVANEIEIAYQMKFEDDLSFDQLVSRLSDVCKNDSFPTPEIGSKCKSCEFRISNEKKESGLESGFEKCWSIAAKLKPNDFQKPMIFDIWNFRKTPQLIKSGKYFISDLNQNDIMPEEGEKGLSTSERQWLQIEKLNKNETTPHFEIELLAEEMATWKYPLHFIDFETTMAAIPFNKGRRPYEQLAFQFSHHEVSKDGAIVHKDEYINMKRGEFPNFDFVRSLKMALTKDNGTIFRYAAHENTVLNQIRNQLVDSSESDKDDLIKFIESITKSTDDSARKWEGTRNMVDLCELVKKYFYHPYTNGSNSIKKVLPAILKQSNFLQTKYSNPIYGSKNIVSKNYKDWQWIELDMNGKPIDPYKKLPPVFEDVTPEELEQMVTENSLADGGAAMTAYSRMQFTEMSDRETEAVSKALLKYCELDTFAMVIIFEYWKHEVENAAKKAA